MCQLSDNQIKELVKLRQNLPNADLDKTKLILDRFIQNLLKYGCKHEWHKIDETMDDYCSKCQVFRSVIGGT